MSTLSVQQITGVIQLDTPFQVTLNSAFGTANSGFNRANSVNTVSIAAFNKANTGLANATGTFAGDLTVTGNVVISSNTVSVGGNNISPVQSFRNKIINGNFDYWQRETSNTSVNNLQYVADRWRTDRTGSTGNISRQSFSLGQTSVPNEPWYFHRTIVTSSAGSGNSCTLLQLIESVRTLAGQTATLSFWAKADSTKNIAIEFYQYFGSGGSPSSAVTTIGVTTCALTSSFQKFTITVNIPSISGKTLGSNNDDCLGVLFWFDAGSTFNSRTNSLGQQSGTFDIAQVQLEAGSVATPFEVRPPGIELALCQRYYETGYMFIQGYLGGPGYIGVGGRLAVSKRAFPTVSLSLTASGSYSSGLTAQNLSSESIGFNGLFNISTAAYGFVNFSASAEL